MIKKLNHRAKIIEASRGKVDVSQIVNTGLFKLDVAQSGYGWLQDLHAMTVREVNGRNVLTPKPETEEYNVQSFIYSRHRPFNPRRLFALLYDKFILQMEHPEEDEDDEDEDEMEEDAKDKAQTDGDMDVDMDGQAQPQKSGSASGSEHRDSSSERSEKSAASTARTVPSLRGESKQAGEDTDMDVDDDEEEEEMEMPPNDVILANKRAHPTFNRLFRSKGEFFLATRPHRAGDWSQAGAMLTLTGGRPWFCTLAPEEYMTGDKEVDSLVQHDIKKGGEWGDRRQELVFIGEKLDHANLEKLLDECLLTDEEMETWTTVMRDGKLDDMGRVDALQDVFDDGFPDWIEDEEGEEEDMEGGDGHEGHNHAHHGAKHLSGRKGKVAA